KAPLIAQKMDRGWATSSAVQQHLEDVSRLTSDPAARRAAELREMFDHPTLQRIRETQTLLTNPFQIDALQTARFWHNHPLRGMTLQRDINVEISPKRSNDLPDSESQSVRVELILPEAENDTESGASLTVDTDSIASALYEFDNYPRVITLTHRPNSSHPF